MQSLIAPDEPPAFRLEREHGRSAFFLICDHAGALIPRRLGALGVSAADLRRHIAWDIGAADVAHELGNLLDATVILQTYSRLVIDCNRPIDSPSSIVTSSERTPIPGNEALDEQAKQFREREIFRPYHDRIVALLADRKARGQATMLISMHSFTPCFMDVQRAWHVGILYNRDIRLAHPLLAALRRDPALVVGDNEPYAVSDATDYAIPEYGEKLGLPHVEIEIRQDLIADGAGQKDWAMRLSSALIAAATDLSEARSST